MGTTITLPTNAPFFQGQPFQALSAPWLGVFSALLGGTSSAASGTTPTTAPDSVSGEDASTLVSSDPNYHKRWIDSAGALHTVILATVSLGDVEYPAIATFTLNGPSAPGWQGSVSVPSDGAVIAIGVAGTPMDGVYPPTLADEAWTVTVDPGNQPDGPPSDLAMTSDPFTVPAPPAPGPNVASGAYVDQLVVTPATHQWGWNNLFSTLPFDPNAAPGAQNPLVAPWKAVRWTMQQGHYATAGQPATFVGGNPATCWKGGQEYPICDLSDQVYRMGNTVSVQPGMFALPDAIVPNGGANPDVVFRLKMLVGSYRAQSASDDTTWTYQDDWSSGVGVATPGTAPYLDLTPTLGSQTAKNLSPTTQVPGQVVPLGQWLGLDGSNNVTLATQLSTLMTAIAGASYSIPSSLLQNQSTLAYSAASQAVAYASGAIAANAIVDSNIASTSIGKLVSGTVVFSGAIALAGGGNGPVVYLGSTGVYLYGASTTSGSGVTPGTAGSPTYTAAGLTNQPYAVINSTGFFALGANGGPVTAVTASAVSLYSSYNVTSQTSSGPYVTITGSVIGLYSGLTLNATLTSSMFQMVYSTSTAATLTTMGLIVQNGQCFTYTASTGVLIGCCNSVLPIVTPSNLASVITDFSPPYTTNFLLLTSTYLQFVSGSFSLVMGTYSSTTNITLAYTGGPAAVLSATGITLYSMSGSTAYPYMNLTSTLFQLFQSTSCFILAGPTANGGNGGFQFEHTTSAGIYYSATGGGVGFGGAWVQVTSLTVTVGGVIVLGGGSTVGAGFTLPSAATGCINVTIGGTQYKVPYI